MSSTSTALQGAAGVLAIAAGVVINIYAPGAGTPLIMPGASVVPNGLKRTLRAISRAPAKGACP